MTSIKKNIPLFDTSWVSLVNLVVICFFFCISFSVLYTLTPNFIQDKNVMSLLGILIGLYGIYFSIFNLLLNQVQIVIMEKDYQIKMKYGWVPILPTRWALVSREELQPLLISSGSVGKGAPALILSYPKKGKIFKNRILAFLPLYSATSLEDGVASLFTYYVTPYDK